MLDTIRGWLGRSSEPWRPRSYRVTATAAGADVNYDCYCGCDAGFALDRSEAEAQPEHCCCGNAILGGSAAAARVAAALDDPAAFRIDVQELRMPWGEAHVVALAIPRAADR
ncbi:MAG: hypothetical protein O2895_01785 [Chloroflexi bacterium]|nr:hypothetical protein [Chloroflexota bacterium]